LQTAGVTGFCLRAYREPLARSPYDPPTNRDTGTDAMGISPRLNDAVRVVAGLLVLVVLAGDAAAATGRRPYITGMVGSSLGPISGEAAKGNSGGSFASPVFNGEGAFGVEIPRPAGAVRVELEGRAFDDTFAAASAQEWSTMANLWRELSIAEHFGAYAGGGIGAGGFSVAGETGPDGQAAVAKASGVAWQAGAGITYAFTDRVTVDVGYRLHGLEATAGRAAGAAGDMTAGEVLLSVRIFEPFRGWRR
jgi:opacity protein-like surface antigen